MYVRVCVQKALSSLYIVKGFSLLTSFGLRLLKVLWCTRFPYQKKKPICLTTSQLSNTCYCMSLDEFLVAITTWSCTNTWSHLKIVALDKLNKKWMLQLRAVMKYDGPSTGPPKPTEDVSHWLRSETRSTSSPRPSPRTYVISSRPS